MRVQLPPQSHDVHQPESHVRNQRPRTERYCYSEADTGRRRIPRGSERRESLTRETRREEQKAHRAVSLIRCRVPW